MIYIIIKILITAIVVVAVTEIAKHSSLLAGLLASIPFISFLSFIWLYWETKDSEKIVDLSNNILLMLVPSLTFFIILPLALKLQYSFIISIILATISTGFVYWLYLIVLNKLGLNI